MRVSLYNMHFATLGGGERRTAALAAHLAQRHDVTLFVRQPIDRRTIRAVFGIDLGAVAIVPLGNGNHLRAIARHKPDLFINNSHCSALRNPAPRGIYMCMFPDGERPDLTSYHAVTANSRFTAEWIARCWGYDAEVVYSACQDMGPPELKQNVILHVGRFFADTPTVHHKRQDTLLRAFRELVDAGLRGWTLHLVGRPGTAPADQAFMARLRADAAGYPVELRPGVSFEALRQAYRTAAVYWHATGYGSIEDLQPSKQEHFGMSVIEAMSAGAVPVVYAGGGPREIVTPGHDGELWRTRAELRAHTLRLLAEPALRMRLGAAAAITSERFTVTEYLRRMDAIIARLTAPQGAAVV